jgi:hypothetical protein
MECDYPGMNPYLESAEHWQGFHNVFVADTQRALNANLPPGYRAVVEQRLAIMPEDQLRRAGLAILRRPKPRTADASGVAVQERGLPDGRVGALFDFWLNRLSKPLPGVRIPLLGDDPDVILDLQAVFRASYEAGRFEDVFDYSKPPPGRSGQANPERESSP